MTDNVAKKVEEFFGKYDLRKYAKGQILIFNGDEANYVYYIVKGRVKEYDVSYCGDEVILNVFHPPAFFPMSLAINKAINPYIYEAETGIEARRAPADDVVQFIESNRDVMFDLLSRVYHGVDGVLGRMVRLMSGSARSRLAYEIVLEAHRFGARKSDGSCVLRLSEKELGSRAGLSRETVNREMHKFKQEGFIISASKKITIKNLEKFSKKSEQIY